MGGDGGDDSIRMYTELIIHDCSGPRTRRHCIMWAWDDWDDWDVVQGGMGSLRNSETVRTKESAHIFAWAVTGYTHSGTRNLIDASGASSKHPRAIFLRASSRWRVRGIILESLPQDHL